MFNKKLSHYKKRQKITQANIWDLEFLRYQLKQQREACRIEYDRLREQIDACEQKTKQENLKPKPEKSIIESLASLKARTEPDVAQLLEQMKAIDNQIEGEQGINSKIDGSHSLLEMLKSFMRLQ